MGLKEVILKTTAVPIAGPLIPILLFVGIWEVIYFFNYFGVFPKFLLPSPTAILLVLSEIIVDGSVWPHIAISLERIFIGYILAIVTAVPFGLLLGWYRLLYRVMEPIVELFRPLPAISMLGFGLLVLGTGSAPIIFVIFYGCFFVILIATRYGTYSIDESMVLALRSMRAKDRHLLLSLVIPSSLPYIFGGLRQSLATALILTVAGEMVIGSVGLGYFIVDSQRTFHIPSMYAALAILGIIGYALTRLLLALEDKMIRWRKAQQVILQ
jgi:ABC-type nitrate/sulfonate/bicarbonate transport system permease component